MSLIYLVELDGGQRVRMVDAAGTVDLPRINGR